MEPQAFEDVALALVEDLGSGRLGHREPLGNALDRDDPLGAEEEGAADRKLADGAGAEDRDRVAGRDVAVLRRHPARREDVGEEEDLLVGRSRRGSSGGPTSAYGTRTYSACPPAYPP